MAKWKNLLLRRSIPISILLAGVSNAWAIPDFTRTVGLPEPKSITLYRDNTDDNLYWAPPTSLEYAVLDDKTTPVFSVLTYGIKLPSISGGLGAVINLSVRAIIDDELLPAEWEAIKKANPNARIAVIAPDAAYMDLILGSALFDKTAAASVRTQIVRTELVKATADPNVPTGTAEAATPARQVTVEDLDGVVIAGDDSTTIIKDPSIASTTLGAQVGAYQVFAVSLTPDAGAVFATNGGEDASNFGVRYRYVVSGIRSRLKAEIKVNWSRLYERTTESAGGGWFAFKGRHSVDIQKLKETGAVTMNIIEGGFESDSDAFETIYNTLVKAQINGEGIFKPTLTANAPQGAPSTSGSFFGWSFSGAWSYTRLQEEKDFTFTIDRQVIGKKSFSIGMAFQGMCAKYPKLFVAQGVKGPGCIEANDLAGAKQRYDEIKNTCETKTQIERASLYQSIGLLPDLELRKIALNNALASISQFKFDCLQGK
ncbi:hypothetical protein HGO34_03110 [Agrobacterium vitis]|uniref:Uncharacterized protein n=1 Tax=Agrobacterium vitis TaxID=373 RepID=A0AAE4WA35_AGRVI|nr:hypothetical protein [Agrobacterium vitis]MCF1497825.1 hypothetical protein [Allorhizobium sp. Av2]MCM2438709.1 hypothetical protein [Agrobacterium vitis]MUZ55965.1 hypothetical protein [Agrobacterium vitis]MVA64897.1 hypothetical protein [Agrobacterium vitis]MVA85868.1 hypothetical protein [Agrobacterium vitis]